MNTQALNNRVSLPESKIKLPEYRKLYASKHFYKCCKRDFRIMLIYHIDDYSLLQTKTTSLTGLN